MTLGTNLKRIREVRHMGQAELSALSGVPIGTISAIEVRKSVRSQYAKALAHALGLTVEELLSDDLPEELLLPRPANSIQRHINIEHVPDVRGKVPLIAWEHLAQWCEPVPQASSTRSWVQHVAEPMPNYYARSSPPRPQRWLDCPVAHSSETLVLCVRGDSMTAPHGRSYPDGCLIFVDQQKRAPTNGQRVIARMDGTDHVTFKVYKNEDGRQWLQPLNPSHEPIRQPFHVLGTVIGKWEDE